MKVALDIDSYVSLTPEGIHQSVFIGEDTCNPQYEETHYWDNMIHQEIEMNTIPGKTTVPITNEDNPLEYMLGMVEQLRDVADRFEARIMELNVLKRDEWVKNGMKMEDQNKYILSIEEYMLENGKVFPVL